MARINKIRVDGIDYDICGESGGAKDSFIEYRYKLSDSDVNPPELKRTERIPSGWSLNRKHPSEGESEWVISAIIDSENTLSGDSGLWSEPQLMHSSIDDIKLSGTPGVKLEIRFCLGTESSYNGKYTAETKFKRDQTQYGWVESLPETNIKNDKVWYIEAEIDNEVTLKNGWSKPKLYNYVNAPSSNKKDKILYPMGLYDPNITYTSDEEKAPYVFVPGSNPNDKNKKQYPNQYYVLVAKQWTGSKYENRTPAEQYIEDHGLTWRKIDVPQYNISSSALIGSAIFKDDYMFSQQGTDQNGNPTTDYQESGDPSKFKPNLSVDFNKGEIKSKQLESNKITSDNISSNELKITGKSTLNEVEVIDTLTVNDISTLKTIKGKSYPIIGNYLTVGSTIGGELDPDSDYEDSDWWISTNGVMKANSFISKVKVYDLPNSQIQPDDDYVIIDTKTNDFDIWLPKVDSCQVGKKIYFSMTYGKVRLHVQSGDIIRRSNDWNDPVDQWDRVANAYSGFVVNIGRKYQGQPTWVIFYCIYR